MVYATDDETVTKVNDLSFHETPIEFFDRIALHNHLFAEAPYTVMGFTHREDTNSFAVIVQQPFVMTTSTRITLCKTCTPAMCWFCQAAIMPSLTRLSISTPRNKAMVANAHCRSPDRRTPELIRETKAKLLPVPFHNRDFVIRQSVQCVHQPVYFGF